MSAWVDIDEAMQRIPGWDARVIEFVSRLDGLTNRSFHIRVGPDDLVLRLDAPHTDVFALDRNREFEILHSAAAAGLAPQVVFADDGILVTGYIDGPAWSTEDLSDTRRLEQVADLLRRVHELPLSGHRMDAAQVAAVYMDAIPEDSEQYLLASECAASIEQWSSDDEVRLCHNDVIAANIIGDNPPILLDWEYACDNDALFDLACLIEYHHLDDDSAYVLLSAYTGSAEPSSKERLADQRRLYDALQFLWFAAREAASVSDPG